MAIARWTSSVLSNRILSSVRDAATWRVLSQGAGAPDGAAAIAAALIVRERCEERPEMPRGGSI